jgi:hypothetical protein
MCSFSCGPLAVLTSLVSDTCRLLMRCVAAAAWAGLWLLLGPAYGCCMGQPMAAVGARIPLEPTANPAAVLLLLQLTSKHNQIVVWQASRPLAQLTHLQHDTHTS